MTHLPGRLTGHLTDSTLTNYRSRLKKLWRIYPHIKDPKEKELCMKEMLKLSDKTGIELGGPTLTGERLPGRGRPRERYQITGDDKELIEREEPRPVEEGSLVVEESDKKLERIAAMTGTTVEAIRERNKKLQADVERAKKEQELIDAVRYAVERQERLLERKCTDQEKALIETEVHTEFIRLANEELGREGGEKGKATGT